VSGLNAERGGEIAVQLLAIYDYVQRRLVEANCQKAIGPAAEVVRLFSELLSAWQAIAEGRGAEELAAEPGSLGQAPTVS
jgi:flagellar protein FliS